MDKFDLEAVFKAEKEMSALRSSISPIAAVLLLSDYSQTELEKAIRKLNHLKIDRLYLRFNIVFQLLQNQKSKFYRPTDDMSSSVQNRYDRVYCDFKEVMKILNRSRGHVESLINEKKIKPVPDKPGKKRSFIRDEIINYAQGIR